MSYYQHQGPEFCGDLRRELDRRVAELIADPDVPLDVKFGRLQQVASTSHFSLGTSIGRIEHAARAGTPVAAFVQCPVVPWTEGVFIGRLRPKKPLEFDESGFTINVTRGRIARVSTTSEVGDAGRFEVSSRYPVRDGEEDPVEIQDEGLRIIRNRIRRRGSSPPFSAFVDEILDSVTGLDFKVTFPSVNLPTIDQSGEISDTYDRMNVVKGLGETTFRAMMRPLLAVPEQVTS